MSLNIFRTQLGFRSTRTAFTAARTFTTTPMKAAQTSYKHENDPETIEKEKAKNLSGTQGDSAPLKETAPGWNENLATDSEATVKADQAAPTGPPSKELQDETVAYTHGQSSGAGTDKGKKAQQAKENAPMTGSEDAVKADRGDH